jgi:hypothetical protein
MFDNNIFDYSVEDFGIYYQCSKTNHAYFGIAIQFLSDITGFYPLLQSFSAEIHATFIWNLYNNNGAVLCSIPALSPESVKIQIQTLKESWSKFLFLSGKDVERWMFYFLPPIIIPVPNKDLMMLVKQTEIQLIVSSSQLNRILQPFRSKSSQKLGEWLANNISYLNSLGPECFVLGYFNGGAMMGLEWLAISATEEQQARFAHFIAQNHLESISPTVILDPKALEKLVYKKPFAPHQMDYPQFSAFLGAFEAE